MALRSVFSDVLLKPSNLLFVPDESSRYHSAEILIVNRSSRILRFRVFCTNRGRYSLPKSKGTIRAGSFVKLVVGLKEPLPGNASNDFFKVQFYDYPRDSLAGERYISSIVHVPAAQKVGTSDSCSSLPSGRSYGFTKVDDHGTVLPSKTVRQSLSSSNVNCFEPVSSNSCDDISERSYPTISGRTKNLSALPSVTQIPQSGSKTTFCRICISLRRLACILAFSACVVGVCLPSLLVHTNHLHEQDDRQFCKRDCSHGIPVCTTQVNEPSLWKCIDNRHHLTSDEKHIWRVRWTKFITLLKDELSREVPVFALEDAFILINPVSVISNFSWFCLGMFTMYYLKQR